MPIEKMKTIDAVTLMNKELADIQFVVEGLIPQGLHILAGAPKAGKSWLLLFLCLQVAGGKAFWQHPTKQGTVLYLCLEDSENRLQARLEELAEELPSGLHFATFANALSDGLPQQIEMFLAEHPDTVLVVIDTLQKVRGNIVDANPYASDYKDIGQLKELADRHGFAMIVVQHLRKQFDSDPHAMVTGSTGIIGAADGSYVLKKELGDATAKLFVRGRDIEEQVITLCFDKDSKLWEFISSDTPAEESMNSDTTMPSLLSYLQKKKQFSGSAQELADALQADCSIVVKGNVLSRKLQKFKTQLAQRGIRYEKTRSGAKRELTLSFSANDDNDGYDDILGSGAISSQLEISSQEVRQP